MVFGGYSIVLVAWAVTWVLVVPYMINSQSINGEINVESYESLMNDESCTRWMNDESCKTNRTWYCS